MGVAGRVARGSFIILARDVVANLATFIGVAVVARVLGPGEYGLASVALVYPGLVGAVVGLGLEQAVIRFASSGGISAGRYVYSGLWASAASGAAGAVAVLALAPLFASLLNRPGIAFGISTLSLYVFALVLFSAVSSAFLGLGWYGGGAVLELVRVFVRVAVSVGLALAGFGYLSVLWGFSLGYLAGALVGLLWLIRRLPPVGPSLGSVAELLRYSLPLHVPSLVSSAVGQALMGLLAVRASDVEMGNLAAASALLIVVNMVANAISAAAFSSLPLLLGDDARLRSAVDKSVFYMNAAVVPVALGVAVFAGPLVRLAYGHAYGAAPLYLSLLAAAYVYNVLAAYAVTLYANVVGRTGFTGLVTVADAGVRALAAVPLIVKFGVWGYLLAPLVATPASAGLTLVLGRRWLGFVPNLRKNAAVGLWALAAFAAALPFRVVSDFLALAVYVAALAALAKRFVAREDALELVELAGGVPIVGPLARRIGNAVVARLFPA